MGFDARFGGAVSVLVVVAACVISVKAVAPELNSDLEVIYANIVFRNGERSRLVRTSASPYGVEEGAALTSTGELQAYTLGKQVRKRYIEPTSGSNDTDTIIGGMPLFDSERVQIMSSGYDRTLESATAFALGLYPPGSTDIDEKAATLLPDDYVVIPVHSSDPKNDAVILSSSLCPTFIDNWLEFFRTEAFQNQQTAAEPFIESVYTEFQNVVETGSEPVCWSEVSDFNEFKLENHAPYNLWDCATMQQNANNSQTVNLIDNVPPPDTQVITSGWDYMEYLAFWIEDRKYTSELAGRMAGGLYITEMMERFQRVIDHVESGYEASVGTFPGMHITSGHYHTLKGISIALDTHSVTGVPEPMSHLAFELIMNTSANIGDGDDAFSVRIIYQDGTDDDTRRVLRLGTIFDANDDVSLDDDVDYNNREDDNMPWSLWSYLMSHLLNGDPVIYDDGEVEWCSECHSTSVDTCTDQELAKMTKNWEAASADARDSRAGVGDGIKGYHVALLSIFGVVMGVGIGLCMGPRLERRRRAAKSNFHIAGEHGLEGWTNRTNGSFRLGSMPSQSIRHARIGGDRANGVHTAADVYDGAVPTSNGLGSAADVGEPSRIPAFPTTSSLGEPVPFPHRNSPSAKSVATSHSPVTRQGGDGGYVVSPVPASNGLGNNYAQQSYDETGDSWEVDGVQEDWGNVNDEDAEGEVYR